MLYEKYFSKCGTFQLLKNPLSCHSEITCLGQVGETTGLPGCHYSEQIYGDIGENTAKWSMSCGEADVTKKRWEGKSWWGCPRKSHGILPALEAAKRQIWVCDHPCSRSHSVGWCPSILIPRKTVRMLRIRIAAYGHADAQGLCHCRSHPYLSDLGCLPGPWKYLVLSYGQWPILGSWYCHSHGLCWCLWYL